jgi:integrase
MIRRRERKQKGQRVQTATAFYLRYYITTNGKRSKTQVKLVDKSDKYKTWADVEPLIAAELERANGAAKPSASIALSDFVEREYLPWVESTKAASTANGYRRIWEGQWAAHVGTAELINLQTAQVTAVLTTMAQAGKGSRALSHNKWFLSGVYEFAKARGIVQNNPAFDARWLAKVARVAKQKEYSLAEVKAMLAMLEPINLKAAVAVALAYFAALRPAEIRGLQWNDFDGEYLSIRRAVWRNRVGDTKTPESTAQVLATEPLRGLLKKLKTASAGKGTDSATWGDFLYILDVGKNTPLSLDSLNVRVIAPACKKAGIDWRGFYPGRRGLASLITDTSKSAANSSGMLRHKDLATTLKYYSRAQKESIEAAQREIEKMATAAEDEKATK